jgi:hypothetical protein
MSRDCGVPLEAAQGFLGVTPFGVEAVVKTWELLAELRSPVT